LGVSTYIVDIEESSGSPNLFVNGINLKFGSDGAKKYDEFARNQQAVWVPTYYTGYTLIAPPGFTSDVDNVIFATPGAIGAPKEILIPTNYNGLTQPLITEHSYDTVYAYSGGTRTVLTAIRYYNLRCKKLVLISPMSGPQFPGTYKKELEDVLQNKGVEQIEIYQSAKDILPIGNLYQAKFDLDDPWLQGKNIKIIPVDLPGQAGIPAHIALFLHVNDKLKGKEGTSSSPISIIAVARDPNRKIGPDGRVLPGDRLDYKVEYENEGEGIAFGVYFTDTLDEDLDDSTLQIGPVIDVDTGAQIAPLGTYNPATRTITWFVGEVGPGQGGYADFSINAKADAPSGTEIINFATVYFPSVPEVTRTNGIVAWYNRPPAANASSDKVAEQNSYVGTQVTLDASSSSDSDSSPGTNDDIVSFEWYEGAVLLGSGQTVEHTFGLGSHTVTLVVTDSFGETGTDEVVITIQDTTPPELSVSVSPAILWPPDHKMVLLTPTWTVSDICDESPTVKLVGITMNEADKTLTYDAMFDDTLGDGRTANDIQVGQDGLIYLRAERSGTGTGRIYTLTWQASDDSGNVTRRSATVTVPRDQREQR
jgi:hypothetical protein